MRLQLPVDRVLQFAVLLRGAVAGRRLRGGTGARRRGGAGSCCGGRGGARLGAGGGRSRGHRDGVGGPQVVVDDRAEHNRRRAYPDGRAAEDLVAFDNPAVWSDVRFCPALW